MRKELQSTDMRRPLFHPPAACGRAVRRRVGPVTPLCNGGTVLVKREGSSPPKMTVRKAIGGPSRCREEASHHVGALRDTLPATSAFLPVLHPSDLLLTPQSRWRVWARVAGLGQLCVSWRLHRFLQRRMDGTSESCGAPRSDPRRNTPVG